MTRLMVEPFRDIDPARVAANVAEVRAELPPGAELLVACKYVPCEEMAALAEAGVDLVGENRLGDLEEKHERWGDRFEWDFIGNLQSRKVKDVLPLVRLIHSVHSDSVMKQLGIHGDERHRGADPGQRRRRGGQGGRRPRRISGAAIERCPVRVVGLSTMPPFTDDPEDSRPHFARLAELAAEHGLERLSMGTSQDWRIALDEGATTIRLGSTLFG